MEKVYLVLFLASVIVQKIAPEQFEWGPCLLQYLEPCTDNTIQFYLFNSDRPKAAPLLLDNVAPKVPDPTMLTDYNIKLIVHGYGGNLDYNATRLIRNAYLKVPKTVVIVADWGKLVRLPCYPTAAFNTKQAGECTATFLMGLKANHPQVDLKGIHAIGFSLGAHVVSFASNILHKVMKAKFHRITGLDPALPFFATVRSKWKLDPSDAEFVDVIHTNAGIFGKIESCGHVDFFVNGGQIQPQCRTSSNIPLCSHLLAAVYFSESINSVTGFYGSKCTGFFQYVFGLCEIGRRVPRSRRLRALMGEHCPKTSRGTFFVKTKYSPPYAAG